MRNADRGWIDFWKRVPNKKAPFLGRFFECLLAKTQIASIPVTCNANNSTQTMQSPNDQTGNGLLSSARRDSLDAVANAASKNVNPTTAKKVA